MKRAKLFPRGQCHPTPPGPGECPHVPSLHSHGCFGFTQGPPHPARAKGPPCEGRAGASARCCRPPSQDPSLEAFPAPAMNHTFPLRSDCSSCVLGGRGGPDPHRSPCCSRSPHGLGKQTHGEPRAETTGLAASPSFTAGKTSRRWGLGRLGAPRCRRRCRSLWPRRSRSWGPSLSLKIVGWGQSQSCRSGARVAVPRWWCQGGETTVSAPSLPSGRICHA